MSILNSLVQLLLCLAMTKPFAAILVVLCLASLSVPQNDKWIREDKTDPLRGTTYSVFHIDGKFLTPPQRPIDDTPSFFVKCVPGHRKRVNGGYINGKLLDAFITVDAIVGRSGNSAVVHYRLDDGKMHTEDWNIGTDGTTLFLPEIELNTVLYGHFSKHKENTNPPVRKLVVGVNEHRAAEVVIQFDMPDPTEMADACGLLIRKK
jgi:hypothetical protein